MVNQVTLPKCEVSSTFMWSLRFVLLFKTFRMMWTFVRTEESISVFVLLLR